MKNTVNDQFYYNIFGPYLERKITLEEFMENLYYEYLWTPKKMLGRISLRNYRSRYNDKQMEMLKAAYDRYLLYYEELRERDKDTLKILEHISGELNSENEIIVK